MALNVLCSCDMDGLVDQLVSNTESQRRNLAAWRQPVTVVVPSPEMGAYLELAVARVTGVAINYEFVTLQGFLTESIEEAAQDSFRVLGRDILKTVLLRQFCDPAFFDGGRFAAIKRYINLAGKRGSQPADTRRYQLARQLATVFEEYIFSRADMLDAWRRGEPALDEPSAAVAEIEQWQAELWRHITDPDGAVRFDGETYLPLPKAFAEVREALVARFERSHIDTLHVFGFAGFGDEFLTMLEMLGNSGADKLDVSIYFSSPTSETKPFTEGEQPGQVHPALRDWGSVGRETLAQLHKSATHFGLSKSKPIERAPSALGKLQAQIIAGGKAAPPQISSMDDSIGLLECPGLRREVEIVANQIWTLLGEDDSLQFSDIAVAVPDGEKDRYLAHIQSVFGEFHRLPYTINSLSLDSQSPVLEAVEQLLRLPFGRFRRGELLSLAVHPNIAGQLDEDDEAMWVEWTERLNILYGADRLDQSARGTYLSDDLFNWEQGLRRLALGSFLAVPQARDEAAVELDGHRYLPQQVDLSEVDAAAAFSSVISSLTNDARWLAKNQATLTEWSEILCALVETYVVASAAEHSDYESDIQDRARVLTALETLADLPDIGEVSYRIASLYALDILSALDSGGRHSFVGGVVVSSPARLRARPFEHVFVMGMGEGVFPSVDPHSELDLRLVEPRQGDILPSERDKYHVLELLKATRQKLRLSWVGRESTTGESVPTSSIVNDLRRMLGVRRPEKETESDELTTVFPLRRYDRHADQFTGFGIEADTRRGNDGVSDRIGANYHPEAFREAQIDALRERIEQVDGLSTKTWTSAAFADANSRFFDAQSAAAKQAVGDTSRSKDRKNKPENIARIIRPPKTHSADRDRALPSRLRYSKLYQFLRTPLQTKAKVFAGMYEEKEDALAVEREPFAYAPLQRTMLTRGAIKNVLTAGEPEPEPDLVGALNTVATQDYAPGDLPADVFQECADRALSPKLENIYGNLTGNFADYCGISIDEPVECLEVVASADDGQIEAPPVRLELADGEVAEIKLVGATLPYFPESQVILQVITKNYSSARDYLRGYIEHLVLSASPSLPQNIARTVVVAPAKSWKTKKEFPKFRLELAPLSRDEAREQLEILAHDLLVDRRFRLLPIELAEELLDEPTPTQHRAWELAIEQDGGYRSSLSTKYGPISNYLDYPPPEDPAAVINRRFRHHPKFDPALREEA